MHRVNWPVLPHPAPRSLTEGLNESGENVDHPIGLRGEGALWLPHQSQNKIAILVSHSGYVSGIDPPADEQSAARREIASQLAGRGVVVLELATVGSEWVEHKPSKLTRREFLHRSAFELGRTLSAYEIAMIQSAIPWLEGFAKQIDPNNSRNASRESSTESTCESLLVGWGEGGRTVLLAAAVEPRIDTVVSLGYFGPRQRLWSEPIDRTISGVFRRFSDAELVTSILPRRVIIHTEPRYSLSLPGDGGGAPSEWTSPSDEEVQSEWNRIAEIANRVHPSIAPKALSNMAVIVKGNAQNSLPYWIDLPEVATQSREITSQSSNSRLDQVRVDLTSHQARQTAMIDLYNQSLLAESDAERATFMHWGHSRDDLPEAARIDTSSVAGYEQAIERYRKHFRDEVIGWYDDPLLEANPVLVKAYHGEGWTGYDCMLDVFPDVFAYGVLLLPDKLDTSVKHPVVVCQHGLEGRPQDVMIGDHYAYHDFAARLAQSGYVVFAPQNPYTGKDAFRTLQRKSYPLGKTLFSIIARQHEQILRWLATLPYVDPDRIAFYGLSYGGKSAMRLPALLPGYCLSICSADFNDWVWKNASTRSRYGYVRTGEYEIFEFGIGRTFNYAEMAALIAPRPFMVERGHLDGVAPDDRVAKEFAKVRFLYEHGLKLPERCRIEWFDGPHTINGQCTFEFLKEHLINR
jgi:hypothetical protein